LIYTDSRYASGLIFKAYDSRKEQYSATVLRQFPIQSSGFYHYTWTERDRIDEVAQEFLGSASFWWVIMDFNPEVIDPFDIPVGTVIRIPSV
jgi:hypothetical protein